MENHLKFSQYQNQTLRQSTPSFRATEALQIPNFNQPNSDSFVQSQPDYSQVELPAIYQNTSQIEAPKTFVEKLKKVDLFGGVYPWFENPLLMGGTCFALAKGLDKYTEKCGGEYEKSILGKATKFGDNLENSKFIQSKPVQSVLGWIKTGANKVNKLLNRSSLITAIRTTPARPEKSMPKSELISQEVRILHDFNDIASKLKLGENGVPALKHLGLDKAEKNYLKEVFGENYKKVATEKTSNTILLKRLGFDKSKIDEIINSSDANGKTKQAILDTLGLTVDDIKNVKIKPEEYVTKVKEAVTRAGKKVRVGEGHYDWLGPIQPLERTISCDQVANKLKSVMEGAKTKTGKFFAKAIQKIHRGFTFGGGKLGMWFFIAPSLVMMLKNVKKADKDQKIGTAAYGSIESISWVFTFPLSIAATYALGGMRFAGMSKENVKKFMEKTDAFNKLVDEGKLLDKSKYDAALKALKADRKTLRHVEKQNLFARMVKGITNFFYSDLNTIRSYKSGNFLGDKIRQIPNFFKHLGLEPIRFILCAFVIESFFRGLIEKGSKAIFGNHYDHMKEEEHQAKKDEQKKFTKQDLEQRLYQTQYEKINPTEQTNQVENYSPELPPEAINTIKEDLVAKAQEKERQKLERQSLNKPEKETQAVENNIENTAEAKNEVISETPNTTNEKTEEYLPQSEVLKETKQTKVDNYTYIPSSENIFANKKKNEEQVKKYIPSQIGAKFTKTFDNSGLTKALRRADLAEQKAVQILAGNFNGI